MSSRRTLTIVQLFILALISGTISTFVPFELPILESTQCGEAELDMSDVVKTVQEMLSSHSPASYPLSCLEIKENLPASPSGYYTLGDGAGNTNIVYCNMDDLYSCPSLEQALRGMQLSLDQNTNAITSQLNSGQEFATKLSTAINESVSNILTSQDVTNTLTTAINNTVNESVSNILTSQDVTNTLTTAINNTVNEVLKAQDYSNTICTDINNTVSSALNSLDCSPNSQTYSDAFCTAINDTLNDVLVLTQELVKLHPLSSCQEVQIFDPDFTSGTVTLTNNFFPNGFDVYCSFESLCNIPGPWERVAFLNMSDFTQNCSNPFELFQSNGVRACGRPHPLTSGFTCESVTFPVNQTSYSQVCGRVIGYQYYSIDGFEGGSIDDVYVDGVSLTHGSPRQHIWSLAAKQNIDSPTCECGSPPAFVGNDFYCESGSNGESVSPILYTSDPLWDGQGCLGNEASCCQKANIPWFHKVLDTSTTDFVELRICGYEDEDTPLSLYEIYVK